MNNIYNVKATENPLEEEDLYEGRIVCLSNVVTDPNETGILHQSNPLGVNGIYWTTVINGIKKEFTKTGAYRERPFVPVLYGVEAISNIDPTIRTSNTRTISEPGKSNTVSLLTMTPKDYFACHALTALIQRVENPLGMDDGTITLIAAKCYKIAQAMAVQAYGSRENDNASSTEGSTDYVDVDSSKLTNDTDRLLYNINESIKANTESNKNTGIKISNIDKVKFDGTPTVKLDGTSEVKINGTPNVNVSNTPNVNVNNTPYVRVSSMPSVSVSGTPSVYVTNMPSVPTEPVSVTGNVNVSGTVSVDNFPDK